MARKKLRLSEAEKWLVLSDPHYPYQQKAFVKAIKRFADDLEPDVIVMNGDGLDFYDLSRFNKNPSRRNMLQSEIDEFREDFLEYWPDRFPHARFHYTEGNHELRLQKYLWHQAPALSNLRGMNVENLIIGHLPWEYHDYSKPLECGHLLIHHGLFARKHGGSSARAMLDRYGRSVMCGHSHRMGSCFRTDYRGVHGAWEQGGLFDKKQQEYDPQPDWQNGFAVVHMWPKVRGYFHVNLIPLIDERWFMYGERMYNL